MFQVDENKHLLTKLAEKLLEKEVIFKEDLEEIFGVRPFVQQEMAGDKTKTVAAAPKEEKSPEPVAEKPVIEKEEEPTNPTVDEPEKPKTTLF